MCTRDWMLYLGLGMLAVAIAITIYQARKKSDTSTLSFFCIALYFSTALLLAIHSIQHKLLVTCNAL